MIAGGAHFQNVPAVWGECPWLPSVSRNHRASPGCLGGKWRPRSLPPTQGRWGDGCGECTWQPCGWLCCPRCSFTRARALRPRLPMCLSVSLSGALSLLHPAVSPAGRDLLAASGLWV